jgi:biopolymer transport protein ExbD
MAAKFGGDHDDPIADINIVPFVDIILVVLIIFMITTPLIVKPSINISLPKAASGDDTTPSLLNVAIDPDGQATLNGKPVTDDDIKSLAGAALAENPEIQAIISADQSVPHGRVIAVMDAVKSAGVKRFAISIDRKK